VGRGGGGRWNGLSCRFACDCSLGCYGFLKRAYSEWLAYGRKRLCWYLRVSSTFERRSIPVAYLTAQMALTLAAFFRQQNRAGAGRSEDRSGNAVNAIWRVLRRKTRHLKHDNHAKAEGAKELGFNEVIDTSSEKLGVGVRRITGGYGADIVIDAVVVKSLSEALGALALDGSLTTLGLFGRPQGNH